MRFTVFGAGAIGGVLAGYLARIGDVSIITRGTHLSAIVRDGLTVIDPNGSHTLRVPASDLPIPGREADITFVAVKAHDMSSAAAAIKASVKTSGAVVLIQNGVPWWLVHEATGATRSDLDPAGRLHATFSGFYAGVVSIGASVVTPGTVQQNGTGSLRIGIAKGDVNAVVERVAEGLTDLGLETTIENDIRESIWGKLAINVGINSLAVLTRLSIADILSSSDLRPALLSLTSEVENLAAAMGLRVGFDLKTQLSMVSPHQKSSTLLDVEAGRPIEYDALFNAALKLAQHARVAMPTLAALAPLVRAAGRR